MARVLFIAPYTRGSGNRTTADRIATFVQPLVEDVTIIDALCPPSRLAGSFDCAIILHAFKAGQIYLKLNLRIPYLLIFGGTDLNCDLEDFEKKAVIDALALGAFGRVCFSPDFGRIAGKLWPFLQCDVQPQSVPIHPRPDPEKVSNKVVLVTGVRPVKDVLFALECWRTYLQPRPESTLELLIVGPILDHDYGRAVFKDLELTARAKYIPFMEQEKLFDLISTSVSVMNSSKSEGQSAALLESMSMGIPVIARDIPGNQFVEHGKTGFLFKTTAEFAHFMDILAKDRTKWSKMSNSAHEFIKRNHSIEHEEKFYKSKFEELLNGATDHLRENNN